MPVDTNVLLPSYTMSIHSEIIRAKGPSIAFKSTPSKNIAGYTVTFDCRILSNDNFEELNKEDLYLHTMRTVSYLLNLCLCIG